MLRYQLESVRDVVQQQLQARLGARLGVENIEVYGLRSIRLEQLGITATLDHGVVARIQVPDAYLEIDLLQLVTGSASVRRARLHKANIVVRRREDATWFPPESANATSSSIYDLPTQILFNGTDCTLRVENVVGNTAFELTDFDFALSRQEGLEDLVARVSGLWNADASKPIMASLRYSALEDFDLRVEADQLRAEDLDVFLPASQRLITRGTLSPRMRVAGYPRDTFVVALETAFTELLVRDVPEMVEPATGVLTAMANYEARSRLLTVTTAKAESDRFAGKLEGQIALAGRVPEVDLRFEAHRLPLDDALANWVDSQNEHFEHLALDLFRPYTVTLGLRGSTEAAQVTVGVQAAGGEVRFQPRDATWPKGAVTLGAVDLVWEPDSDQPRGAVALNDGMLEHPESGFSADRVMGRVALADNRIRFDPLNAHITGHPVIIQGAYDTVAEQMTFEANGVLANVEKTPIHDFIKNVRLRGAVDFRANGTLARNKYSVDAALDLTQASAQFEWWFRKPVGMGMSITGLRLDCVPDKTMTISGSSAIDATELVATFDLAYDGARWRPEEIRSTASNVDVNSLGRCLHIPYTVTGTSGSEATLHWRRAPGDERSHTIDIAGAVAQAEFLPRGGTIPLRLTDARIEVSLDNRDRENLFGACTIDAGAALMPPLEEVWFVPLRPDDLEMQALYPPDNRHWDYTIAAAQFAAPPWDGAEFSAQVKTTPEETRADAFRMAIANGYIEGSLKRQDIDNVSTVTARWERLPSRYLLEHLDMPEALSGLASGAVEYTYDEDNPEGTLKGNGAFTIAPGQFSADYVVRFVEERLEGDLGTLPPSLRFNSLSTDILLDGDRVSTPKLQMSSDEIEIRGNGHFIRNGDLNYKIRVAVAPKAAQRMDVLREYFNVDGHRLTKSDIDLVFDITGPAFNPSGQVSGLPPVGVTMVSGVVEVGSEALKVLDTPRKMLMDVFKIVGGSIGPGKAK